MVFLLVITIITVVVWVGFDIYRTLNRAELPTGSEQFLKPLNPTLKISVFDKLSDRIE